MTDYFALLGAPRRPWLDAERLKEKFFSLSKELHPDRTHGGSSGTATESEKPFAEINAAYNCLRDPRDRLRHLLQLELGSRAKEAHSIPPDLMDVSLEVGALCREADRFLDENAAQTSALIRAQMFERGQDLAEKLMTLQKRVGEGREDLLREVQKLDEAWTQEASAREPERLGRLQEIETVLGFEGRWMAQLQERVVRLAL